MQKSFPQQLCESHADLGAIKLWMLCMQSSEDITVHAGIPTERWVPCRRVSWEDALRTTRSSEATTHIGVTDTSSQSRVVSATNGLSPRAGNSVYTIAEGWVTTKRDASRAREESRDVERTTNLGESRQVEGGAFKCYPTHCKEWILGRRPDKWDCITCDWNSSPFPIHRNIWQMIYLLGMKY